MLYDNALLAPAYLHGWLVPGKERYREVVEETLEYVLRELPARGRRIRLGAGRGHGRRRGADVHVDGGQALPAELLQPFEHGRSCSAASSTRAAGPAARGARGAAAAGPRRQGGRLVERARDRGARRGRAEARPRGLGRGGARRSPSSARPALDADGRLTAPGATGARAAPASSTTTRTSRTGCYELHVATGELRWLEESRRLARLAVDLFADDERGGFYLTPAEGEQLVARTKALDDHPSPAGNSMLAYVLLRLARIYGDDELERRACRALRLVRTARARAARPSAGAVRARPSPLAAARARDRRRARRDGRTRGARAVRPNAVVAFGPAEDVPLLAGKTVAAARRSTSASASPAARPSPIRRAGRMTIVASGGGLLVFVDYLLGLPARTTLGSAAWEPRPATPSCRRSMRRSRPTAAARRTWRSSGSRARTGASISLSRDLIWVGGGNTASMLGVWRAHGVDEVLREAWKLGVVLAGASAGAICWFEAAVTDGSAPSSTGSRGRALPGSCCPHYDGEENRKPALRRLLAEGFPPCIAIDDFAAVRFEGTEIAEVVVGKEGAGAYRVDRDGETPLRVRSV